MTYITKHLPSLEALKKELETHPEKIKYYTLPTPESQQLLQRKNAFTQEKR